MRSKAYPSISLGVAVQKIEQFNKSLGSVGYYARQKVAEGIGYKGLSGASSRAIAALVHYGLLDRKKDTYALSELAKRIVLPKIDGDRETAIKEALIEPALFRELIQQYEGAELPGLLSNILTTPQYGINPRVKDDAAEVFKSSLAYAGVLKDDHVIFLDVHEDITTPELAPAVKPDMSIELPGTLPKQSDADGDSLLNRIEIVLREGVKAGIYAPYNLSAEEKLKLKTIIDLL